MPRLTQGEELRIPIRIKIHQEQILQLLNGKIIVKHDVETRIITITVIMTMVLNQGRGVILDQDVLLEFVEILIILEQMQIVKSRLKT
jgi:hypothetical protein